MSSPDSFEIPESLLSQEDLEPHSPNNDYLNGLIDPSKPGTDLNDLANLKPDARAQLENSLVKDLEGLIYANDEQFNSESNQSLIRLARERGVDPNLYQKILQRRQEFQTLWNNRRDIYDEDYLREESNRLKQFPDSEIVYKVPEGTTRYIHITSPDIAEMIMQSGLNTSGNLDTTTVQLSNSQDAESSNLRAMSKRHKSGSAIVVLDFSNEDQEDEHPGNKYILQKKIKDENGERDIDFLPKEFIKGWFDTETGIFHPNTIKDSKI